MDCLPMFLDEYDQLSPQQISLTEFVDRHSHSASHNHVLVSLVVSIASLHSVRTHKPYYSFARLVPSTRSLVSDSFNRHRLDIDDFRRCLFSSLLLIVPHEWEG